MKDRPFSAVGGTKGTKGVAKLAPLDSLGQKAVELVTSLRNAEEDAAAAVH